jgi:hypothetical protein
MCVPSLVEIATGIPELCPDIYTHTHTHTYTQISIFIGIDCLMIYRFTEFYYSAFTGANADNGIEMNTFYFGVVDVSSVKIVSYFAKTYCGVAKRTSMCISTTMPSSSRIAALSVE